ncbi:MAG: PASTA domain-containing protein, partial [Solirubrobacteraceae bacterium]
AHARSGWEPSPRRDVNPPARRRAVGALGLVVALLAAMAAAAVLLGGGHARVPRLTRLTRAAATVRARAGHLHAVFASRYDRASRGLVIAQRPQAGLRVADGTPVRLVLSRGPAPVQVPVVADAGSAAARTAFARLGLHTTVTAIPAPGTAPGTVIRTRPVAGARVAADSTVALLVAQAPQWRTLTTLSGAEPVTFRVRGSRWRVVYRMAFHGTCTWIFFCSGPHARIVTQDGGSAVPGFGLDDGGIKTQTFKGKPGTYQLQVTPGGDEARWSLQIEDYY